MSETCEYSVVRYYPDSIAGECINIGVIVLDGPYAYRRMLRYWERVCWFAPSIKDYSWVRERAREIAHYTADEIRWQAANANHSIQFSAPQPSLDKPDALIGRVAARYLKEGARNE